MPDILFQLMLNPCRGVMFDCPCLGRNSVIGTPLAVLCPLEEGKCLKNGRRNVFGCPVGQYFIFGALCPSKSGLMNKHIVKQTYRENPVPVLSPD
jgi:hypothetical protein